MARPWLALILKLGALLAGWFLASAVQASTVIPSGTVGLNYVTGGVQVVDGAGSTAFIGRTFFTPSSGGAGVAEKYALTLGGNSIGVTATRALAVGELAAAAQALVGSYKVGYAVGTEIAKALGIGPDSAGVGIVPTDSGWQVDGGQDTVIKQAVTCSVYDSLKGSVSASGGSRASCGSALANALSGKIVVSQSATSTTTVTRTLSWDAVNSYVTGTVVYSTSFADGTSSTGSPSPFGLYVEDFRVGNVTSCSNFVDALNPSWSGTDDKPASPRADGKCPTGRYSTSSDSDTLAALSKALTNATNLTSLLGELLDKGGSVTTVGDRVMSGPSSVPGTPTTTTVTNPDGTTTTTTTTPTTNYTYSGDQINYGTTTSTVTNTCTGTGSCATSTSTTTTGGKSSTASGSDNPNDCQTNPGSVGCSDLGTPPTDTPTWSTKDIQYQSDALGLPAACPADRQVTLPFSGAVIALHWQPACDVAPTVRAALLALVALSCAVWVVSTLRS